MGAEAVDARRGAGRDLDRVQPALVLRDGAVRPVSADDQPVALLRARVLGGEYEVDVAALRTAWERARVRHVGGDPREDHDAVVVAVRPLGAADEPTPRRQGDRSGAGGDAPAVGEAEAGLAAGA